MNQVATRPFGHMGDAKRRDGADCRRRAGRRGRRPRHLGKIAAGILPYDDALPAMPRARACPLPSEALLARYSGSGAWLDSYCADLAHDVDLARFVEIFYTGALFRLERRLLQWFAACPSTDDEARRLARGAQRHFSAWQIEDRTVNQLLMADVSGRTRSWLMVEARTAPAGGSRLYFGSAILPVVDRRTGRRDIGPGFRNLLGFHRIYSRSLLGSAANRLARSRIG